MAASEDINQSMPMHSRSVNYDLCCVGHITLDKIVTPDTCVEMPGGTAYYFASALSRIQDGNFLLVTSVTARQMDVVEQLRRDGVEVEVHESESDVYFENSYGRNFNNRTQRLLSRGRPFTWRDLSKVNARMVHFGSLLADDFSEEVIFRVSEHSKVSVDAQGFLRKVEAQDVVATDWREKHSVLRHVDILKVNGPEALSLTGEHDLRAAMRVIASWGVKEVVLTLGSNGSTILYGGVFYDVPSYQADEIVDATGSGDTYMAGYLYRRVQGDTPMEAGRYAAAMSSIKQQRHGPFRGGHEDVMRVMTTARPRFRLAVD